MFLHLGGVALNSMMRMAVLAALVGAEVHPEMVETVEEGRLIEGVSCILIMYELSMSTGVQKQECSRCASCFMNANSMGLDSTVGRVGDVLLTIGCGVRCLPAVCTVPSPPQKQ